MSKMKLIQYIVIALFCAIFVYNAISYSFTQDDAFISYRYVKNFLNGDGLTGAAVPEGLVELLRSGGFTDGYRGLIARG